MLPVTTVTKFNWSKPKLRAATLIARGKTIRETGREIGWSHVVILRWLKHAEFQSRVSKLRAELGAVELRHALAAKERRLTELEDQHARMKHIRAERSEDMANVPGGRSGLLVRRVKSIGSGENAQVVEEYEFDAGLAKEMRETLKTVAIECGQWELNSRPAGATNVNIAIVSDRRERARSLLGQLDARSTGRIPCDFGRGSETPSPDESASLLPRDAESQTDVRSGADSPSTS